MGMFGNPAAADLPHKSVFSDLSLAGQRRALDAHVLRKYVGTLIGKWLDQYQVRESAHR